MVNYWDKLTTELDLSTASIKSKFLELKELDTKSAEIDKELKSLTKYFEGPDYLNTNTKSNIGYLQGLKKQVDKFAVQQTILIEECTNHLLEMTRLFEGIQK